MNISTKKLRVEAPTMESTFATSLPTNGERSVQAKSKWAASRNNRLPTATFKIAWAVNKLNCLAS
jgi:hypothetical protein